MIAFWLTFPFAVRILIVALIGLIGGSLANYIIYRFAYFDPRPISPWGPAVDWKAVSKTKLPRRPTDRLPVVGWLGLRREAEIHGAGFWIRPLLIELLTPLFLIWLYVFYTQSGGLLPSELHTPAFLNLFEIYGNTIFFSHAMLIVLMVAATFIDFDERTIPDVITIPGTLAALCVASATPYVFLPTAVPVGGFASDVFPTIVQSPWFMPARWQGPDGLIAGLGIWSGWCFALSDRRFRMVIVRRRGWGRAVKHFVSGLFHYGFWKLLLAMWLMGLLGIGWVWTTNGTHWLGLFTALVGLAVGGGVVWAIRIVASWSLHVEAMGFGDVTLMAMIGAFIGWQASLVAFFLSPFAAIVIVLLRYVVTRDPYTPYGPYLCAGTMVTIVYWDQLYNDWLAINLLTIGGMLLWLSLTMLGLMAAMLFVWRHIKMAIYRSDIQ